MIAAEGAQGDPGTTDHGDQSGLADDDHSQYARSGHVFVSSNTVLTYLPAQVTVLADAEITLPARSTEADGRSSMFRCVDIGSGIPTVTLIPGGSDVLVTGSPNQTFSQKTTVLASVAEAGLGIPLGWSAVTEIDMLGLGDSALLDVGTTAGTVAAGDDSRFGDSDLVTQVTGEPHGFPSRTDNTISFDNASREFTIAPTGASFKVWASGTEYTISTAQTFAIPDTTGLYYIFFDGEFGYQTSYFDWPTQAPTSYIYWNQTTQKAEFFADERHGITLDWANHEYLHRTRGAALANGFALGSYSIVGDGSLAAHAQVGLADGTFFDEDLEVAITNSATPTPDSWEQILASPAQIPVFRLDGTQWVQETPTTFPLMQGSARIRYNLLTGSTWSVADVGQADYGISWIVATNNLNYPVIAILGQDSYGSLPATRAVGWEDLTLTNLPIVEMRPLWKLAFQTSTAYANTPHARLREVTDIRGAISTGSAITVNDHGLLAGLADDDHTQYALADGSRGSFITAIQTATISGTIAENAPNTSVFVNVAAPTTTGVMYLSGIWLAKGTVCTSINFNSGTTGASAPTNQWFVLCDSSRTSLANTVNDGSTAWAGSTAKTLALTAPFTTTYSGLYYIGYCITATTLPSMRGISYSTMTPIKLQSFISTTGLTTPSAVGTTFAAWAANASLCFGGIS